MKEYKDVIETEVVTKLVKTTCDICGLVKKHPDVWEGADGAIDSTTIKMERGYHYRDSYPEQGSKETTSFDICSACFETELIPWMAKWEAKPQIEESNW
jgi:hypothetical protein